MSWEYMQFILEKVTKAVAKQHVRKGRSKNLVLSSSVCSAIDGFKY